MESVGKLYGFYDPDEMRAIFKKRTKKMVNKTTTLKDAVSKYLKDGDYIAAGNSAIERTPVAALMELIRQVRKNDLKHLKYGAIGGSPLPSVLAFMSGCFEECDISYGMALEALGISKMARRCFETGKVKVTEWSNGTLAWRVKAAAMGLSFIPARSILGTDTFKYSAAKEIKCPFTGKTYAAIPAVYPDIVFIHVHAADKYGNSFIKGTTLVDVELAEASKTVIVTTERLVPTEFFRDDPLRTTIPFYLVDAVVEVPYGAHPGGMPYEYHMDVDFLKNMLKAAQNEDTYEKFIKKYILDCENFEDFLQLTGGLEKMRKLRQKVLHIDAE
ncbi:CoA transferase subunit A [Hippea alviniae]|uniref:CoA transferase subunit A n=1 Tax=Hippea alviniae TaxID=1279027 RepID=UPI0003B63FE5|nr:CoA-transferase [Hippea alviniae]